jgi:membrane AbrB-like protein
MSFRPALHVAGTLLLALAAALLCVWVHAPIPWMIGPLLATSLASILGAPTRSWPPLRNAGQWMIATALGLYFTPQVTGLVASLWWAILLAIVWTIGLGWLFARWLQRSQGPRIGGSPAQQWATCYFAGAVGGASEMTLLAERENARSDLVAASHSVRIVIVTLFIPFAFTFTGQHGADVSLPAAREVYLPGLLALGAATLAGALLIGKTGWANPWFMGALAVSMGISMAGLQWSAVPQELSYAAQMLIGISLGVRFQREFLHAAPRWLAAVALGTIGMVVLCAAFAAVLAWGSGLNVATLTLGTAPGGIAEMAITAKALQLGVPVVTAFQVCRLVAVLVLVAPLYRRLAPR